MKIYVIVILFVAILLVSGCIGTDTTEDDDNELSSITPTNLTELKEAIEKIQPENPAGFEED